MAPSNATVALNGTLLLSAMGQYSDGSTSPLMSVNWSSSNLSVATIDPYGTATAQGFGLTKITATDPVTQIAGSTTMIVPNSNFDSGASLLTARSNHTATLLTNSGKVLVTGGWAAYASGPGLNTAELLDPNTSSVETDSLAQGVFYHTATLLSDGMSVLIAGGQLNNSSFDATTQAEIYQSDGTFRKLSNGLNVARQQHTATLLPRTHKVLIVGGYSQTQGDAVNTAEIFDPTTETFAPTSGSMAAARYGHSATLLGDGRVLIVGGFNFTAGELTSAELYDPTTDTFSSVGQLSVAAGFGHTATLIPDKTDPTKPGKVLIAAGIYDAGFAPYPSNTAELFDPASGTGTKTGSLITPRYFHTATTQSNGTILFIGGQVDGNGTPTANAEVYDPASGTFSQASALSIPRDAHSATLLLDGRVLVIGGVVSSVREATLRCGKSCPDCGL